MNSRERLRTALDLKEPDRVPIDLGNFVSGITHGAHKNLREYLNLDGADEICNRVEQTVYVDERILERLRVDLRYLYLKPASGWQDLELGDNIYQDEFGVQRRFSGLYYDIVGSPFKDFEDPEQLEEYPWPDPRDGARYEGLDKVAKKLHEDTDFAVANANTEIGTIFENCWYMRGFEQFLMDFYLNPEFAERLLDKWCDYWMAVNDEYLDRVGEYVDMWCVGDDLTGQSGPHLSLDMYREFIKPRMEKLYSFIKSKTDAKLYYHICGSISEFAEDLIDLGIDVFQPVQREAKGNDLKKLKERLGDRVSFSGGISQQKILPFGTPEEVEDEVKNAIDILGEGGGYLFITGHNIQADVPPENILAAYDAAYKYGGYSS